MRYILLFCLFFAQFFINASVQAEKNASYEETLVNDNLNKLKERYQIIKQAGLDQLSIKPDDIYPLIETMKSNSRFEVKMLGESFLERPIYKIKIGHGPIKILMWSQMHGDEPTATASLFDLFNYLDAPENNQWVKSWQDQITLHMAPMINPDGAKLGQRFNAQSIDINRDAKRLQTPEGKILNAMADSIQPDFGFNLHDQARFYTVGDTDNTATISLLAPAFNVEKEMSDSRHKAMQVIGLINDAIQKQNPNHVGRYDDSYAFRAFGDAFSAKGIATTLIESGHYPDDPNRQVARWLTFLSLIISIDSIADNSYGSVSLNKYHSIPMNHSNGLVDLLLKNVHINNDYTVDISINFNRKFKNPKIIEIGDLSANHGLVEKDMADYQLHPMKGYPLNESLLLTDEKYLSLLQQGFGYFVGDETFIDNQTRIPVTINPKNIKVTVPQRKQPANFLFSEKGKIKLALIKGEFIEL